MADARDNSGTLSRNLNATTDRHPTHKGRARIGCVDYWVSAWIKEGGPASRSPGQKFFSLAFDPVESGSQGKPPARTPQPERKPVASGGADWQDEIPF